jgi:glycosyltransferase involved in cell wall biosynthesis
MNPKVSVCIPAYKQIPLLRRVLESILAQTFQNYELIITDDSPDKNVELLLKEFDFKGNLKYYHNETPLGSPANWNYAISLAKGEYIKILHTDDFFTSAHSLASYVKLLDNNPAADFAFSASEVWSLKTDVKKIFFCSPRHLKRLQKEPAFLFFRNVIGGPSATIQRNNLKVEYDTRLKWLVDVDFYIRILNQNKNIVYCNEPLICTVDGAEGQITQRVISDKTIQIREPVILFSKLTEVNPGISKRKYLIFFKLLFDKFKVKSLSELNTIVPISDLQKSFFSKIISSVTGGMFFTRLLMKFYNSSLNKNILKMDLF